MLTVVTLIHLTHICNKAPMRLLGKILLRSGVRLHTHAQNSWGSRFTPGAVGAVNLPTPSFRGILWPGSSRDAFQMALFQQRVLEPPPLDGLVDRNTHVLQWGNVEAGRVKAQVSTETHIVTTATRCMQRSTRITPSIAAPGSPPQCFRYWGRTSESETG